MAFYQNRRANAAAVRATSAACHMQRGGQDGRSGAQGRGPRTDPREIPRHVYQCWAACACGFAGAVMTAAGLAPSEARQARWDATVTRNERIKELPRQGVAAEVISAEVSRSVNYVRRIATRFE